MDTVTQVTTDFQRSYPDCTTATAERLINRIHREVMAHLGVGEASEDISLTAGTRHYTLTEENLQIRAVYYIKSASNDDYAVLYPYSQDEGDIAGDGFRERTTRGQPRRYFLSSAKSTDNVIKRIGFDPIPDTTTSGGYPVVRVLHHRFSTLATSDELPEQISGPDVYTAGMRWLWALDQRMYPEAQGLKQIYDEMLQRETAYYNSLQKRNNQRFDLHNWVHGSRVV